MVSSEDLEKQTDAQLIEFADQALGIVIEPGTQRPEIMVKIVNAATATKTC